MFFGQKIDIIEMAENWNPDVNLTEKSIRRGRRPPRRLDRPQFAKN